ncbi:MAG: methionyl aminopeptidase [Pseudonocardiales bacterium]|uniref:type I methionyl aminopeptidase n=1 Tax=Pseudonocardia sp. TaxID=60912 RepID=UPI002639952A|nr:type I methionyl aminopeptidase [Pseudonocardia sp.]MCW2720972.1 Methionine aminopeptidase [Pseudonocardia sp.]MDT7708061.1 methionyl aminopeptidase [Pseudonocardiales bacterium]
MIELKTPGEIDAIDAAGTVVARILAAVRAKAAPGVSPRELDDLAADMIADAGAVSSFQGYHPGWAPVPYPGVTCISVNDAVVHGIPGPEPLTAGDLLSVDFAVHLDGWCADSAFSIVVGGDPDPRDLALIDATERALAAGIAAVRPGAKLGDVGHAIETIARRAGFGMLADHGGHGVGRSMHEAPHVPNEGRPGRGLRLKPGLVIAIEPMLIAGGTDDYRHDPDGWTLRTADGSRAAHAEHTVAVTKDGVRLLTRAA